MQTLTSKVGRILFSIPFIAFGLMHLANADAMAGAVPVPGGAFWIYFTGICLVAGGLAVATGILGRWGALGLAALMLVFVVTMHIPGLSHPEMRQMAMGGLLKDLGLAGGALTWAGLFGKGREPVRQQAHA